MKAKYFTADSLESAAVVAMGYFGCNREDLTLEQINANDRLGDEEENSIFELLAITGTPGEVANMDAHYTLYYENDGVYLELYKRRGGGYMLVPDELLTYLKRKKIKSLDDSTVGELIKKTFGREKIAGAQDEYVIGEELSVVISEDEMKASAVLHAPEPGGALLNIKAAESLLTGAGVMHGVDTQALTSLLESKIYEVAQVVAVATPPEDGEDGKLIFHFSIDERTGSPKEIDGTGGRVNYRTLDIYVPVDEGQLLVTRTYATRGTPGRSVTGRTVEQKPGKEAMFPRGKNVDINDDKTEMYSQSAGMVEYINGSVNVSNIFSVKGDCDMRVGDIDFDGSVHITGNVCSGSTIKATGGVIIDGSVEAATIIAGGNVEVKGGMQGADKGMIEAGGAVSLLYVERGKIQADGPVKLDMCIHSIVEAGSTLTVEGRRGAIIGGRVSSCGDIVANYVGAISNTRTEVAVGVTPRKRARLQNLIEEIDSLNDDIQKLNQLDTYLANTKGTIDPLKWNILHNSGMENRRINNESLAAFLDEKEALEYELENATDSKIHVFNTVYTGSRVLIGRNTYVVKDEISYVSFKHSENEVTYGPCELVKKT